MSNHTAATSFKNKHFNAAHIDDKQQQQQDVNMLRLDNSIKKESFLNQWRNKCDQFEADFGKYLNESASHQSNRLSHIYHHGGGHLFEHHLSNRDVESLDKESLCSQGVHNENNSAEVNLTTTSATPAAAFRFAVFLSFFFNLICWGCYLLF